MKWVKLIVLCQARTNSIVQISNLTTTQEAWKNTKKGYYMPQNNQAIKVPRKKPFQIHFASQTIFIGQRLPFMR